jgi:hypothetical protein
MKQLVPLAFAAALLLGGGASAKTERCRDSKGHLFVKCPGKPAARSAAAPAPARAARATVAPPRARLAAVRAAPAPRRAGPARSAAAATGPATAKCRDGSLSYTRQHTGACSRHGGVANWL